MGASNEPTPAVSQLPWEPGMAHRMQQCRAGKGKTRASGLWVWVMSEPGAYAAVQSWDTGEGDKELPP
jgi:hypothetical protein